MTSEEIVAGIALIVILGTASQWIAQKIKIPSILLLLGTGFIVGAVTGILDPDELFGNLLFPLVSISVALILYEGGLTLNFRELRDIGKTFFLLITVGALITWALGTAGAYFILDLNLNISVLLGAILIVSGPTVVGPLLRHVRPSGRSGNLLRWEGIFIDPVGAILAVITLQAVVAGEFRDGSLQFSALGPVAATFAIGGIIGLLAAAIMLAILKNYLIPDLFQNSFSLAVVLGVFALSNSFREESGLFAVTLLGLALANQNFVSVRHIIDFKENLRVLIISSLFIILAARLDSSQFDIILSFKSLLFLLFLIVIVRPLAILLSTSRSPLGWNEKAFLAWMAPRGIVAASVASIFGIELADHGIEQADLLVPYTFLVIIGTVLVYGLTALPVAEKLGLSGSNPQGLLFVGAHPMAQEIGLSLMSEGFRVLLIDTNRSNIRGARLAGLPTYYGNILAEYTLDEIDLTGIGKLLALTQNDEVNSLAAVKMAEIFERQNVYQLATGRFRQGEGGDSSPPQHLRGRSISGTHITFNYLRERLQGGATLKTTRITENYQYSNFREHYGAGVIPMFMIDSSHNLRVFSPDRELDPQPGDRIISFVNEPERPVRGTAQVSPDRVLTAREMEEAGLISSYCEWQTSVQHHGGVSAKPERRTPVGDGD